MKERAKATINEWIDHHADDFQIPLMFATLGICSDGYGYSTNKSCSETNCIKCWEDALNQSDK